MTDKYGQPLDRAREAKHTFDDPATQLLAQAEAQKVQLQAQKRQADIQIRQVEELALRIHQEGLALHAKQMGGTS